MKYIFIANANAGKRNAIEKINEGIKTLDREIDYEIYKTTGPKDATRFVKEYSEKNPDEKVGKMVEAKGAKIVRFARIEKGEGLEKREENFAEEVAKQMQGN